MSSFDWTYLAGAVGVAGLVFFVAKKKLLTGGQAGGAGGDRKVDAVVISGPSGVGKGTLINKLLKEFPTKFGFSVSHTSRAMREGERNGVDYHFAARDDILKGVQRNEFFETCEVHGNIYGTSKAAVQEVRKQGKVCIIEIDVQGAQKMKQRAGNMNLVFLFVKPPEGDGVLEARIRGRGKDPEEKIATRLETAKRELQFLSENNSLYDKVITNDDLEVSYSQLKRSLRLNGAL